MKHILVIHHYGGLGGAGKSLLINIKRLVKYAKVTVIVPKYPTDMYDTLCGMSQVEVIGIDSLPGIPIYSGGLSLISPRLYTTMVKSIFKFSKLKRLIEEISCDAIIANSIILCWISLVLPNLKKICFVRESKRSSIANIFIRKCLNRFDLVVFISRYDRKEWELLTKTEVIENASDHNISKVESVNLEDLNPHGKLCVLFMGGTSRIKGFYHLLLSALLMKNRNRLKLIILGDSKPLVVRSSKFLLRKFGIECLWLGLVENVSPFINACDVLVFPVIKVHQGRPIFEAGAFKKPAVAPDFENLSEFVTHNYNGLTYRKRSSRSLAKCLDKAIKGDFDLISLGQMNYKIFCKHHTVEVSEKKFNSLIKELLQY